MSQTKTAAEVAAEKYIREVHKGPDSELIDLTVDCLSHYFTAGYTAALSDVKWKRIEPTQTYLRGTLCLHKDNWTFGIDYVANGQSLINNGYTHYLPETTLLQLPKE